MPTLVISGHRKAPDSFYPKPKLPACNKSSMNMERRLEQDSGEIRSGDAMSIFGQSIDVRRPLGRSRRRATQQKKFSPVGESPAKPSVERPHHHQRRAIAERERARAESDLSRASSMAKELEQQIEQANAKARSHRSELQATRAGGGGGSSRRKNADAPGAKHESNMLYVEVMQELDRVKRELRNLRREVKAAREASAQAEAATPMALSSDSRVPGSVPRDAGEANQGRALVQVAEAGGLGEDVGATRTRAKRLHGDTSRASDGTEERFATASSSDVGLESTETATEERLALTTTPHGGHDGDRSSRQAAEAELNSARIELESIREQGVRFSSSMERTRRETARVAEEIVRLVEQEQRAGAQVQQLNAGLLRARSRLDAATAADERYEAALAELSAALRQLGEETEAAEKEKSLTELENQCVREDADAVSAEVAAAEQRVRESVKELELARASEATATAKLRAIVEAAALARAPETSPQRSRNVTVPRFEYEYLTGRAEVVRTIAEKKVAAAEAWVEALRAGEKELAMRAEMIEREIGEADAADGPHAEEREPGAGLERAQTRRRPAARDGGGPATSRRMGTPSSSVVRKPSPPSFSIKSKKTKTVLSKYMRFITGKCRGQG
ncbi:hypothetical protein BS78_09G224600 [Paspalum vaginatum]|nr:hypothetical protein BS78_09G224600 [Paspalum vaginatum]